jgi:hypothetical protein
MKIIFAILIIFLAFQESKMYNITNHSQNNGKEALRHILEKYGDSEPILKTPSSLALKFITFAYKYITEHELLDLEDENVRKCVYQGIIEQLEDQDFLYTCIIGSGKALNDFGNEFECESSHQPKAEYFTLHFLLKNSSFLSSSEDKIFMDFLDQHYFYIGLCVPKLCKDAINNYIKNEKYLNILYNIGTLSNFTINFKDDLEKKENLKFFSITINIYFYFIIGKILIGILRIIYMNEGYAECFDEKYKKKEEIISLSEKDEKEEQDKDINNINRAINYTNTSIISSSFSEKYDDASMAYNEIIYRNPASDEANLYNPFSDNEKKYPFYLKLIKVLDFFDNVYILSNLTNRYYNSFEIRRLYFIRFVLMIMSIVYQLIYAQMDLPYRNFVKYNFYTSPFFIIIKLCINASTFWITLDAAIIGYKIMSFMKKEIKLSKNGSLKFFPFFKFILLVIPKFVTFFFAFVYLHIFSSDLTYKLCENNNVYSSFLYYNDTVQHRTFSIKDTNYDLRNILKNFIPFRLNYIDFYEKNCSNSDIDCNYAKSFNFDASGHELPSPFLTNTELFVNVYLNEFYLLVLMLFITFISYKLRSKIFDYSILSINIILYFLPLLDLNKHAEREKGEELKYTLRYVLGQNYTEKYTHYFINFFYFGFVIGVMKFYYDENVFYYNQKKRKIQKLKLPFEFCEKIILTINKMKFCFKRMIIALSIFFLFLISASFYFMNVWENEKDNEYNKKIIDQNGKTIIYYLFLFEKNISGIFFFIILMIFIVYPKNRNIIQLAEREGFIILERISFCFYCSFSYCIYAQFCVFIITLQLSYMNLFLNTLGIFLIIFSFSLFNTVLFELPFRQLIKSFMNRNLEQKFVDCFDKNRNTIISKKED